MVFKVCTNKITALCFYLVCLLTSHLYDFTVFWKFVYASILSSLAIVFYLSNILLRKLVVRILESSYKL